MQNVHLLEELQLAFSKKSGSKVIDLDNAITNRRSFSVLRIEDLYQKTRGIIPPFRRSDFCLVFVKHGSGKRSIGHATFTMRKNTLAVVSQRMIHAVRY